ncbi:tRNA (cytosine(38)-C(5))-methyltransferase isoform X1 [Polyodon spathula]|uniref:tRNA (cytosine(38)-C(5))-methyltransferase isoform X1 n=1 Tax=Polyodon spathula TaxID=7913 RepID=UPI001B7DBFAB|nr:tRNA (cytosine(38)-C(5))-methyltransferase isoform X1 [Polyodon spathula]
MGKLRVLELYSGIGGMHYALKGSCIPAAVVAAVDVNTTANAVYKHNFPSTHLWPKTIEGVTLNDFNKLAFDMILMSPPCQPFTRIGLQGDVSDPRTKSFLYILNILPRLDKLPKFILLENVKGFETSSARDSLVETLQECGYRYQEFLLSPTCLGIPNSRLRYFLIAKLQPGLFSFETTNQILEVFPHSDCVDSNASKVSEGAHKELSACIHGVKTSKPNDGAEPSSRTQENEAVIFKLETAEDLERKQNQDSDVSVRMLQDFLEVDLQNLSQYLLPPKTLLRYAILMDIVQPTCRRSVCFTKGYGHYVEGTGSVLQSSLDIQLETAFKSLHTLSDEDKLNQLLMLKLRYFTPREIANLHGLPPEFCFPEKTTLKQRYRLLGNSLNACVVARLIKLMVE